MIYFSWNRFDLSLFIGSLLSLWYELYPFLISMKSALVRIIEVKFKPFYMFISAYINAELQ